MSINCDVFSIVYNIQQYKFSIIFISLILAPINVCQCIKSYISLSIFEDIVIGCTITSLPNTFPASSNYPVIGEHGHVIGSI